MRTAFIETLCELAQRDSRIWLLTGDLGYSVIEPFVSSFPERFINAGIAEQNMAGVAAGLALSGKIVFVYSIANFPVMRCLEQVRNDICYHNLNVKIVAVGGGVAYGAAGYSHHAIEDLAVTRVMPNMTVLAPGDPIGVRLATKAIAAHDGPCYLRLGKGGEPVVHGTTNHFSIGKAIPMRNGADISIISTGGILHEAILAAKILSQQDYSTSVVDMPTLKPFDESFVLKLCKKNMTIVTVEEHGPGGLGSLVAEIIARSGRPVTFIPITLTHDFITTTGDQKCLRITSGIVAEGIAEKVLFWLKAATEDDPVKKHPTFISRA